MTANMSEDKLTMFHLTFAKNTCGQTDKGSMSVNYDSRVIPDFKMPHYNSRAVIYSRRAFIRLTTGAFSARCKLIACRNNI